MEGGKGEKKKRGSGKVERSEEGGREKPEWIEGEREAGTGGREKWEGQRKTDTERKKKRVRTRRRREWEMKGGCEREELRETGRRVPLAREKEGDIKHLLHYKLD